MPHPPLSPLSPPSPVVPRWGCDSCGLLFNQYKRGLDHGRDSPAHAIAIKLARENGGLIAVDSAIAGFLTWYQPIPPDALAEVKAATEAAQIVADATVSDAVRLAVRKGIQTPQKRDNAEEPTGDREVRRKTANEIYQC